MLPVRSAIFKQDTGGLVVRWVTTGEYPLLYVFVFWTQLDHTSVLAMIFFSQSQSSRKPNQTTLLPIALFIPLGKVIRGSADDSRNLHALLATITAQDMNDFSMHRCALLRWTLFNDVVAVSICKFA
jgi:hypothetical protein